MNVAFFTAAFTPAARAVTPEEARAHMEQVIAAMKARQAASATNTSSSGTETTGDSTSSGDSLGYGPMDASPNGLSTNGLILSITPTNDPFTQEPEALLTLINTTTNLYQLLSKPSLDENSAPFWPPFWGPFWIPGQIVNDSDGTNQIAFDPVPTDTNDMSFFRAASGDTVVGIFARQDAFETNHDTGGQPIPGIFELDVSPTVDRDLTVVFRISGVASNGVDYEAISNFVTIGAGATFTNLIIQPRDDARLDFEETVVLDLVLTNGYVLDPGAASACLTIHDLLPTNFLPVADLGNGKAPIGIDYHPPTGSLLISQKFDFDPNEDTNFVRVASNGVVSSWSGVTGLLNEVKVATAKQTINGFTNGEVFFSSSNNVGWLSADGTISNLAWCMLTNSVATNAQFLRGGFYWDETGVWSNQLIVVTSDDQYDPHQPKEVWRVDAQGHPTLVAQIPTAHLEGVIVLTNDVARWGPWAGKIITGDELEQVIYAIDTNGVVMNFPTPPMYRCGGISPEDFDVIKTNQDLYACDPGTHEILKLSRSLLAAYVGDLMITQAGEFGGPPRLFIVHWDGANFIARAITYEPGLPAGTFGLEHVTFAPIDIPPLP